MRSPRRWILCTVVMLVVTACAGSAGAEPVAATTKPINAKLSGLDGRKTALKDLRGTPALLELWATWCLPCQEQAAVVESLGGEFERRGVAVYAVNVGEELEKVAEHIALHNLAAPVLLDRLQTISTRLRIEELPALVLLQPDGSVAATAAGLTDGAGILAMLDQLEDDRSGAE